MPSHSATLFHHISRHMPYQIKSYIPRDPLLILYHISSSPISSHTILYHFMHIVRCLLECFVCIHTHDHTTQSINRFNFLRRPTWQIRFALTRSTFSAASLLRPQIVAFAASLHLPELNLKAQMCQPLTLQADPISISGTALQVQNSCQPSRRHRRPTRIFPTAAAPTAAGLFPPSFPAFPWHAGQSQQRRPQWKATGEQFGCSHYTQCGQSVCWRGRTGPCLGNLKGHTLKRCTPRHLTAQENHFLNSQVKPSGFILGHL